jgi:inorganic pyrophosphatase
VSANITQHADALHVSDCAPLFCRIESFVHWLKFYKADSGIINAFGFGGTAQNREYAEHIIEECHGFWKELIKNKGQQAVL